ncbi:HSP20 family molecular chaperone IbpA [Oikeobacillus pervagus]|uniref:HSP20 family molecular chaperone IbpA n=1 Tax=Oikeobacillus pervagus TaxID=1325931 RepID=A0AAJ1T453_9BACI|nr:hypothetical protein [Oikeobacillus pervagus]MDQ0214881.1 HSP20 family molecular chaperone IbpA [Oikeobacillus pervagus]
MDWQNFDPLKTFLSIMNGNLNNPSNFDHHMNDLLSKYLPTIPDGNEYIPWEPPMKKKPTPKKFNNYQIYNIHGYMIIQINLPNEIAVDDILIQCGSFYLSISFSEKEKLTIPLTVAVQPKLGTALFQDDTLEIRLPKAKETEKRMIPIKKINPYG